MIQKTQRKQYKNIIVINLFNNKDAEVEGQSMSVEYSGSDDNGKRDLTDRIKRIRLKGKEK
jgi:hypothetical protein